MDDLTRVVKAPSWEPAIAANGRVEICINYFHENGRKCFEGVSLRRYIELWDKKSLEFQLNKKPKPQHLPTREEALKALQDELKRLNSVELHQHEGMYETPPLRDYTVLVPVSELSDRERAKYGVSVKVKPQKAKPVREQTVTPPPKPAPPPVRPAPQTRVVSPPPVSPITAAKWDINACTEAYKKLSLTNRQLLSNVAHKKIHSGVTKKSAQVEFSRLCTAIGLPKERTGDGFKRAEAVLVIVKKAHESSVAEKSPQPVSAEKNLSVRQPKSRGMPDPKRVHAALMDEETKGQIIEEYRKAAQDILGRGGEINVTTLSGQLNLPKVFVSSFLYQNPTCLQGFKVGGK